MYDITRFAKSFEKILDMIGMKLKPGATVKQAIADANAEKTRSLGKVEARRIEAMGEAQLEADVEEFRIRARVRLQEQEERRQLNRETITAIAYEIVETQCALAGPVSGQGGPEAESNPELDHDWLYQFFDYCEDISNEQMRLLWAKLLAGEVTKPGAFSLQTLATVKMLRHGDAELFTSFCSYVWHDDKTVFPITGHIQNSDSTTSLKFDDVMHLEGLGLIQSNGLAFNRNFSSIDNDAFAIFRYFEQIVGVKPDPSQKIVSVGQTILTSVGRELFPLSGATEDREYFLKVIDIWSSIGFSPVRLIQVPGGYQINTTPYYA